ncbi:hypothetical protein [Glutamicibacter uratoxydans]|uniref:hypothetical protein n=1 Tax=Glutamicibacter uratoxydans TaxID=43667 RepID=UPI003D6EF72A
MGSACNEPAILLDEPATGLDPQSRVQVWNSIREMTTFCTTATLPTQYPNEAKQLADRLRIFSLHSR